MSSHDRMRVFLKDCKVNLRVGIYNQEKTKPQPVVINLEVEALIPHHYGEINEHTLDRVINYETFYNFIQNDLLSLGHVPLLETIADYIIVFCFSDQRIEKVKVRVEKPEIFPKASVGIEIQRSRRK